MAGTATTTAGRADLRDGNQESRPPRRVWRWVGGTVAVLVAAFAVCELLGWPFLAGPLQRTLSSTLHRQVSLAAEANGEPMARIHLLGGLRIQAPHFEIGAPEWSQAPHMLLAKDASLTLGYFDLWRASRGEPLRIRRLSAASLDGHLERLADGRASWQFGDKAKPPDDADKPTRLPTFGRLQVDAGTLGYRDALIDADLDATFSLIDGSGAGADRSANTAASPPNGLTFEGRGHYQKQPLRISLQSGGLLQVASGDTAVALPFKLDARIGGAGLTFDGTATDPLHLTALKGKFSVKGPSLAAIGDPLKVTLPSTPPFATEGWLAKDGVVWNVRFDSATIGASRLGGAFKYDPRPAKPVLLGKLTGPRLFLADLGPTIGAPTGKGTAEPPKSASRSGRVLPDKEFDLPSLRAMNANVLIDIGELDSGTTLLQPLEPLRTHLVLQDGVLTLQDIDARTAQGRLTGSLQLDGRQSVAVWRADLGLAGVKLEQWLQQKRGGDAPPYVTGRMSARTRLQGEGKSTAAILGSLNGEIRLRITDGSVSHLAMEVAGLDIAQGLGVLIKGDSPLPLACSFADIDVVKGMLTPKVMVIDNRDSTIWVQGDVSLATEAIDLKISTEPKDFSPLALRTPVMLKGTFADPKVSIEAKRLGVKAGAAALLGAIVAPIAAIIPLLDFGDKDEAARGAAECKSLAAKMAAQPMPAPAKVPSMPGHTRQAT